MNKEEEKNKLFKFKSLEFLLNKLKDDELSEIINDWKWIFSYSKRYRWQIAVFTLFGIASTTFGLVSSVANKYMLDIVTGRKIEMLWLLIIIWLGTNIISVVMNSVHSRYNAKVTTAIKKDVQQDVFHRILNADWMSLQKYTNGDMLDRINSDASTISDHAISWVPNLIILGYNFIATFLVIWHYSKGMTLIAIISAPVLFLVRRNFLIKEREYHKNLRKLSSNIYSYETESFNRMDTVKSMGLTESFMKRFDETQEERRDYSLEKNAFDIKRNAVMSILRMIVSAIAFVYALWLLWNGNITYGTMVLFLQQRNRLTNAMMSIGSIIPDFVNSSVSAHRIVELIELPQEKHKETTETIQGKFTLDVKDPQFGYVDEELIVKDGKLKVSNGEIVAIVGPTGLGKTTILRMMLGLIYPSSGICQIKDNNNNIIGIGADTRGLFSYVPQGNSLFAGTIAENLRMIKQDASEKEMIHALKMADAWEFVEKLPEGIEHKVFENGIGLSEGQAQRVAIARALLRGAPILLFDEATSALDVATEARVLKNLKKENKDHAIILTTHRSSVLEICDRVYQMKNGHLKKLSK